MGSTVCDRGGGFAEEATKKLQCQYYLTTTHGFMHVLEVMTAALLSACLFPAATPLPSKQIKILSGSGASTFFQCFECTQRINVLREKY